VITEAMLYHAQKKAILPFIVTADTMTAQILYDFSLSMSLALSIFFTPFLTYLVYI